MAPQNVGKSMIFALSISLFPNLGEKSFSLCLSAVTTSTQNPLLFPKLCPQSTAQFRPFKSHSLNFSCKSGISDTKQLSWRLWPQETYRLEGDSDRQLYNKLHLKSSHSRKWYNNYRMRNKYLNLFQI